MNQTVMKNINACIYKHLQQPDNFFVFFEAIIICLAMAFAGCQQEAIEPKPIKDPTQTPEFRAAVELFLKTRQLNLSKEAAAEIEYQKFIKELEADPNER